MQQKKCPERTCISCRQVKNKQELIRVVKTSEGKFVIDKTNKTSGRGAYICNDIKCLEKAIKSRALNRSFKAEISEQVYLQLKEEIVAKSN